MTNVFDCMVCPNCFDFFVPGVRKKCCGGFDLCLYRLPSKKMHVLYHHRRVKKRLKSDLPDGEKDVSFAESMVDFFVSKDKYKVVEGSVVLGR